MHCFYAKLGFVTETLLNDVKEKLTNRTFSNSRVYIMMKWEDF